MKFFIFFLPLIPKKNCIVQKDALINTIMTKFPYVIVVFNIKLALSFFTLLKLPILFQY